MTQNFDTGPLMQASDVPAALGLLSRLPVRVDMAGATARGARAAWAYPVAGLILGALACAVGQIALWWNLSAPVVAGLVLASLVTTTGAMHEDGLADSADGLWGGWDRTRRLEIMKDSHIGVYGVAALVITLGLRWQALALLIAHGHLWPAVLVVAMLSRAAMVPLMARLPHARDTGLSHSVGRPGDQTALAAVTLATVAVILMVQLSALMVLLITALTAATCAVIAKRKIGGQTGDILGATQTCTEIAVLLTLSAALA